MRSFMAVAIATCFGWLAIADSSYAYETRIVDIPARDGVRLHTLLLIPNGARDLPILLTRTPFGAQQMVRLDEPLLERAVPLSYSEAARHGYIFAFQDIRGKFGSGGDYVVMRPIQGPLNASAVDHSTDAWDSIDWLVKHVPESNGKVATIGKSYAGFTALMALIHPHPALKAAVPINPVVDVWKGDDWFHNGAFRQITLLFISIDVADAATRSRWQENSPDDYTTLLAAGSAGAYGRLQGLDPIPFWRTLQAHPAYDFFWQGQALDHLLATQPLTVPTLYVASLWDQEDSYGAVHAYLATRSDAVAGSMATLVLGPWSHGQLDQDGSSLGPLRWDQDTSAHFRTDILQPFLDAHLKQDPPAPSPIAGAIAYEVSSHRWKEYDSWPRSCASGCPSQSRSLYLQPGGKLSFSAPATANPPDSYISDPNSPVPYRERPLRGVTTLDASWKTWLVEDQRKVSGRTDVLSYATEILAEPITIAGEPEVNLIASTSATDSDWIVKLIDVFPDTPQTPAKLRGYQLAVGMEIFRGRYWQDPANPQALQPQQPETYRFELPAASYVFMPGHRIMIQVQSSWFPLYDRNPQKYVPNIFTARAADYQRATQRIFHSPQQASFVELPVVTLSTGPRTVQSQPNP